MLQDARWPLVLEPMEHPLQPTRWQPTSSALHRLPNRTRVSSARGVTPVASKPNCSSRGKKADPTGRARAIGAPQLDRFSSRRLDVARLLSSRPQRLAAGGTRGTLLWWLLAPVLILTRV